MIRIVLILVSTLAFSACKEEGPTASRQTSPRGLEYTLIHMPAIKDVTIQVAWPTDWAYRADVNQAAPYIGAQLILVGGAEGFQAGDVGERFADLNSEGNLTSTVDHVLGELTFEKDHMDETIAVANAHLRAPGLGEIWFERIRDGIALNMAEKQSQPAHRGFDAVRWAVFGDQPLRNALSLDGPGTFQDLTRADVVAWHSRTITRTPDAIVVAGGINASEAGMALDGLFEGLPEAGAILAQKAAAAYSPRRILLHIPDAEVTSLAFVAPLPPTRKGGELEDLILVDALGGGNQDALFEAIRTGLRATYAFGAGIGNYSREHRFLFMTGAIEAEKLSEAEQVVRETYAAFRQVGPKQDLADHKAPLATSFSQLSDFVLDQARSEMQAALDGFGPGSSLSLSDELADVTLSDVVKRLDEGFPDPDSFLVIAVSADADALPGACIISNPREAADCP